MSPNNENDPFLRHLDQADVRAIRRMQASAAQEITPAQRQWSELYVGPCRFNASAVAKRLKMPDRTSRAWREKFEVRRYCATLMAESAARLTLSRNVIVAEVARLALSDVGELLVAVENAREAAQREAAECEVDVSGIETPEKGDGHQRAAPGKSASTPVAAGEILRHLGRDTTATIRRIKFGVAYHDRLEWVEGGDGELVQRLVERIPITTLDEIHMHDKLAALEMLAPWFGLEAGSMSEDGEDDGGWQGQQIIPPKLIEDG
jgi:hypothetical protein